MAEKMEATLDIRIIHAIATLLAEYTILISSQESQSKQEGKKAKSSKGKSSSEMKYNELMDIWIPKTRENYPKCYCLNTSEEAELYGGLVRVKMIRSNNSRLFGAATEGIRAKELLVMMQSFGVPVQSMT